MSQSIPNALVLRNRFASYLEGHPSDQFAVVTGALLLMRTFSEKRTPADGVKLRLAGAYGLPGGSSKFLVQMLSRYILNYSDVFPLSMGSTTVIFTLRKEVEMPRRSPFPILLSESEREQLEAMARKYTAPYFEVVRAKLVLLAADGLENQVIGERLDLPRQVVSKWRKRFYTHRLEGLSDQPRSGRPAGFSPSRGRAGKGARL